MENLLKIFMFISWWAVTVLITLLGVFVGQTLWVYEKPVMGIVDTPVSYFQAVVVGIAAWALSVTASVTATYDLLFRSKGSPQ